MPVSRKILEKHIKQAVKKRLNELGCYHYWPVPMGIGAVTIDCLACLNGRFIGIETKKPGGKPTPLQILTMNAIEDAGGTVLLIDSLEKVANINLLRK